MYIVVYLPSLSSCGLLFIHVKTETEDSSPTDPATKCNPFKCNFNMADALGGSTVVAAVNTEGACINTVEY